MKYGMKDIRLWAEYVPEPIRAKIELENCMSRTGNMTLNINLQLHYISKDNDKEELHRGK